MKTVIVGNPENRRVVFFQKALSDAGFSPAVVVSYQALLEERSALLDALSPGCLLRIESPGENFAVERALLVKGAPLIQGSRASQISAQEAQNLSFDLGRILYPRQCHLGFCRFLQELTEETAGLSLRWMNHPEEIQVMFDKILCHERFVEAKIPVPRSLGPIQSYEELRSTMQAQKLSQVFVKLFCGSSASGVIAYRRQGNREEAITSAELVRQSKEIRLYNSLRIRRYTRPEDIEAVINAILKEGAIVQEWLPKATHQGKPFDLRVVVINQEAKHFVVRVGNSPMTNLHLGNARGDPGLFLSSLKEGQWEEIKEVCQSAAKVFPKSLYAGVDLLLTPDFNQKIVLEINAFGDLLPNVLCDGVDTYTAELNAFLQREGSGSVRTAE